MAAIARLQRANHRSHFRAFGLRGAEVTEMVDPFLHGLREIQRQVRSLASLLAATRTSWPGHGDSAS